MKKVVVIGAGYGGLRAVEQLAKNSEFHITLIDINTYHYMQTEAYGYIAGRFDISDIAIDLESFVKGVRSDIEFIKDEAISIDEQNNSLKLKDSELTYDYALISVGARTNFFSFIKGAEEFTHGVKIIQRAFEFRQEFEKRLYLKLEDTKLSRKGDLHIAIAGAGLSGVEIATEMANSLKKYKKILSQNSIELKITLIDAAPSILPGMDEYIIKHSKKRLKDLGVKIYVNTFIQEIKSREIIFKDGKSMDFDFIIYTAGIKASPFVKSIDSEKNRIGQIVPDEFLRLKNTQNIFVIGDAAELKDGEKNLLPPTAQMAERSAEYVVKTINDIEANQPLDLFDAKVDGVFVALGGKYAIGVIYKKIKIKGYFAYILKKVVTRLYRFGLEMRVNAGYKKR